VRELHSQTIRIDIAKTDPDESVRAAVVATLADQRTLVRIAQTDRSERVREAVVQNLNLTDEAVLARIAKADGSANVYSAAVAKVSDQALLGDVASTGRSEVARIAAVKKLIDEVLLTEIATRQGDSIVGLIAYLTLVARGDARLLPEPVRRSLEQRAQRERNWRAQLEVSALQCRHVEGAPTTRGGWTTTCHTDVRNRSALFHFQVTLEYMLKGVRISRHSRALSPGEYTSFAVEVPTPAQGEFLPQIRVDAEAEYRPAWARGQEGV
jgi:hypothetical protein